MILEVYEKKKPEEKRERTWCDAMGQEETERKKEKRMHEGALKQETWNEGHAAHQCKLETGKGLMSASAVADAN